MPSLSFMIDRLDSRPVWVWLARRFQARTGRAFLPNGEARVADLRKRGLRAARLPRGAAGAAS
jgi:hypothetical protein